MEGLRLSRITGHRRCVDVRPTSRTHASDGIHIGLLPHENTPREAPPMYMRNSDFPARFLYIQNEHTLTRLDTFAFSLMMFVWRTKGASGKGVG